MDTTALVNAGHKLLDALAKNGKQVRAAMWVHNTDVDTWKLWIVPHNSRIDPPTFYREIVEAASSIKSEFPWLDAGYVEMKSDNNAALVEMQKIFGKRHFGEMHLENNRLGDFYLTDGIVLYLNL